jgi:hypothetical protein
LLPGNRRFGSPHTLLKFPSQLVTGHKKAQGLLRRFFTAFQQRFFASSKDQDWFSISWTLETTGTDNAVLLGKLTITVEEQPYHSPTQLTSYPRIGLLKVAYAVRSVEQHVRELQWESIDPEGGQFRAGTDTPEKPQPTKKVIYERGRVRYNKEYLQANADKVTGFLPDALRSEDPALSSVAEQTLQALHVFAEAVVKTKGTSLSKASRDYHIPLGSLSEWVAAGLIPMLYRDRNTIYVANEIIEQVAHVYRDGKARRAQIAPLLKAMRDELGFASPTNSRT